MTDWRLLQKFLDNPSKVFSILILGERGTGKTRAVSEIVEGKGGKVVVANCASFPDDTMAESQLFGYEKGAFTGAVQETDGLFQEAADHVLFLDEVHTLSPRVQQKLMTALQTAGSGKNKGKFRIRKIGSTKDKYLEFRPVFASNLTAEELRKVLLPDFYDRIAQLVVRFPSITDLKSNVHDEFVRVWKEMKFEKQNALPDSKDIKEWLQRIPLTGNYRTLQAIAIAWHQGRLIYGDKEDEVFVFAKEQFNSYHNSSSPSVGKGKFNFRKGVVYKQLLYEYRKELYEWAVSDNGYRSAKAAQEELGVSRLSRPKLLKGASL